MKCITSVYVKNLLLWIIALSAYCEGKKTKCLSVPSLPAKVEKYIKTCQQEIKHNIIDDLVHAALAESVHEPHDILKQHVEHLTAHRNYEEHHPVLHHYPEHIYYSELPHDHNPSPHYVVKTIVHEDHHNYPTSHHIKVHSVHSDEIVSHPEHLSYHEFLQSGNHHHHVPEIHRSISHESHQQPVIVYRDPHRVTEAHEELMKLLANHKVVDRHANHDELEALLGKLRNETSDENNLENVKRVKRRSLFGVFGFSRSTSDDEKKEETESEEEDSFHATLLASEDKWLAGCLMQCVFNKNGALDKLGYPTLDGLVELYTSGTSEQKFFIHVLRSVDKCLKSVSVKHLVNRKVPSVKGELCEVAFDIFDCVSDSIIDFCNG